MSEMNDDGLLDGEELDDDYDITNETEEALLQDEDDYSKGRNISDNEKNISDSDIEEPDDVVNLDVEDFHDLDKTLYEEEPCKKESEKFSVENTHNVKKEVITTSKAPAKPSPVTNKFTPSSQKTNTAPQRVNNNKKPFVRNDKWKKGNEKGNFQPRQRFNKNNVQRRRNGTVLINPRYEGTVHITDNNARLAWDNSNAQYPQQKVNMITPWVPGKVLGNSDPSSLLVTNLMTGIASLTQQPPNMILPQTQPSMQNFYHSSGIHANDYKEQLSFEPPPPITESRPPPPMFQNHNMQHAPEWDNSYIPHNQMNQQIHPPVSMNRIEGNSYPDYNNSYNRNMTQQNYMSQSHQNSNMTNFYENRQQNYNRPINKSTAYNNYPSQNNFQNKNSGYGNNYQNRTFSYPRNDNNATNYNNSGSGAYEDRNPNKNGFNHTFNNSNYKTEYRQNQNFNKTNSNFQNRPPQQTQLRNDSSDTNSQRNNMPNRNNFNRAGNRRPIGNEVFDPKEESPEKRTKMNEQVKVAPNKPNDQFKPSPPKREDNVSQEQDEDEETRLYRLKIEEQKRERERILQIKEQRRQQMILQRQKQDEEKLVVTEPKGLIQHSLVQPNQQPPKLALFTRKGNFENTTETAPVQTPKLALFTRKGNFENTAETVPVQTPKLALFTRKGNFENPAQTVSVQKSSNSSTSGIVPKSEPTYFQRQTQLGGSEQTQYSNNAPNMPTEMSSFTFKVSNDFQSNAPLPKDPPKTEASSSSFMSNRVVVVKGKNSQKSGTLANPAVAIEASNESSDVGQGHSSFFNNRKVLKKDNNLLNTKLVVVNNLSATINQNKLMALSRGIGEIQTLRVDKQERQATILFKSVASAHAFFKKYQRRILDDLSVIEVKLEPML